MTRIYILACQYGSEQHLLYAVQASEGSQSSVGDLCVLFQELSIHLKDTFHLTKEQNVKLWEYLILSGWKRCGAEIWIGKYEVCVRYLYR